MTSTVLNILRPSLLLVFTILAMTHSVSAQQDTSKAWVKVQVDGLACPFCAYGLEKALTELDGARDIFISVKEGYATFTVPRSQQPSEETLTKLVKNAGFTARKVIFSDEPFARDEGLP